MYGGFVDDNMYKPLLDELSKILSIDPDTLKNSKNINSVISKQHKKDSSNDSQKKYIINKISELFSNFYIYICQYDVDNCIKKNIPTIDLDNYQLVNSENYIIKDVQNKNNIPP